MLPLALIVVLGALAGAGTYVWKHREEGQSGLAVDEMDLLRRAELALAAAPSTDAAARELSKHAMVLLDAPAAVVLGAAARASSARRRRSISSTAKPD
jgi:hypothetical protein